MLCPRGLSPLMGFKATLKTQSLSLQAGAQGQDLTKDHGGMQGEPGCSVSAQLRC